jgi:hypothetical protein
VLNFGSHGSWQLAAVLRTLIPFWNARVQGLYRGYRGAVGVDGQLNKEEYWGKMSKKFLLRGATITGLSLGLMALNWDDDRYNALPDWDRHTYYHIYWDNIFPKSVLKAMGWPESAWHWAIPKPFEVGAVFSTLPEEMIRTHLKDVTMKDTVENLLKVGRDQLNLLDWPQAVKPMLELSNNINYFTGGPIVPQRLEGVLPEAQYTSRTSEVAKEVGGFFGISPVKLDHAVRAYTGSLGTYVMSAANAGIRELRDGPERPTWTLDQMPEIGRFVRNHPMRSTRYLQEFYEMKNEVQAVHKTFRKYREEGRRDDARKLKEEKREALRAYKRVMNEAERISKINKRINTVESHKSWSGDVKQARLKRLYNQRNRLAERIMKRLGNHF